jgi:hypothetical protein
MARGYLDDFGDLIGKLGAVRAKCGRSGQYRLAVLIADCPRMRARVKASSARDLIGSCRNLYILQSVPIEDGADFRCVIPLDCHKVGAHLDNRSDIVAVAI